MTPPRDTSPPAADLMASAVDPSRAFAMVPVWIVRHPNLSANAVRLYGLLAALYVTRPGYTAPAPTLVGLADDLGVTERAIRKWRDELLAVGAIATVKRPNRPTVYVVAGVAADGPVSEQPFTAAGDGVERPFHTNRNGGSTPTTSKESSYRPPVERNDRAPDPAPRADERSGYRAPLALPPKVTADTHARALERARDALAEGEAKGRARAQVKRDADAADRLAALERADREARGGHTVTRGRTPRVGSSTGARCQFPGCAVKAASTVKAATLTINGHPVTVDRLCAEHRALLARRARTASRQQRNPRVPSRVPYLCHGCGTVHRTYTTAERCADSHGGARIEILYAETEATP